MLKNNFNHDMLRNFCFSNFVHCYFKFFLEFMKILIAFTTILNVRFTYFVYQTALTILFILKIQTFLAIRPSFSRQKNTIFAGKKIVFFCRWSDGLVIRDVCIFKIRTLATYYCCLIYETRI